MDKTNNFNVFSIVSIDDRVRKPLDTATSMTGIDSFPAFGRLADPCEGFINSPYERKGGIATSGGVPVESVVKFRFCFRVESNRHPKGLRAEEHWLARLPTASLSLHQYLAPPIA